MLLLSSQLHAIEFNSHFLNIDGSNELNLSQFSQADYTMPGTYLLDISVNDQYLGRQSIRFVEGREANTSYACLPGELVKGFGLKPEIFKALPYTNDGACVDLDGIEASSVRYIKSAALLKINIPQVAFEYDDPNYIPRERWSNGVDGAMLDYHVIANTRRQTGQNTWDDAQSHSVQSYGTVGANLGAWRFRGDYQAQTSSGGGGGSNTNSRFTRLYAFRALPDIRSTASIGNNFLNSDVFDTFAYTGASIQSDDRMLPPALRGYAPLVSGVARSNATVTVSQQGRVLYATKVSSGAFALQGISANVQGTLDVTVQEEDGSVQRFQVVAAAVPFLAREGELRFKAAVGQPRLFGALGITPTLGFGEAAYGLPAGVTLYGGMISASGYTSVAAGAGKDLGAIGAVSADVTTSRATLWWNNETRSGRSYRVNYSKHFDSLDTDLRFLGYRFSDRTYTTFSQFTGDPDAYSFAGSKQRFSISLSKRLFDVSTFLSYDRSTYWDRDPDERFGVSLARSVSIGALKNVNLSLSAFHNRGPSGRSNQIYVSATIPFGDRHTVSTNVSSSTGSGVNANVGFSGDNGDGLSYSAFTGSSDGRPMASGNIRKTTSNFQVSAQASTVTNSYSAAALQVDGSVVATQFGVATHANGNNGDTRLLVSTDGVPGVPLLGGQARTNGAGYAVIGSVSPFDTFDARINTNKLGLDTQVANPVQRLVLTEGAIGFVNFNAARGRNLLVALSGVDGKPMPFGASVTDLKTGREIGIVGEQGSTYLTQVQPDSELVVNLGPNAVCHLGRLPDDTPPDGASAPITCSPATRLPNAGS
ncbi:fimbria/pilus outer membrane usher protein [Variovorax sp. YR216]|uniref:fimbria/pilus outer membrane usher protein n=1 Tax=Variovorax sp. YR216 TaxID=1882828 RepID=UPI000B84A6B7|nr:fimbria/pilus outer membrane usher protein [Variovorax sp. YR216]